MLIHWMWLATRPSMSDRAKVMMLQHFSDPEDIYFADDESFAHIEGLTRDGAQALRDKNLSDAQKILEDCARKKIHILTLQDASYPTRLKHIPDPPLVLYYKGTLPDFDGCPMIGVVGTRKYSLYGAQVAKRLGEELARCGGVVVSGMADGIDGFAMSSAISAGGMVVGVMGCGADVIYPWRNRGLYRDLERYGCILSEFPPGTEPLRWNFPKRNRIISGLSCGVLVVEAPEGSGALITANHALEQGRDVFTVPGNIDLPTFTGNYRLMRDGATLVRSGWELLSEYQALFPDKVRMDTASSRQKAYPDEVQEPSREAQHCGAKVAQKTAVPEKSSGKKPKGNKKVIDNAASSAYSDVNKNHPELTEAQRAIVAALEGGERLVDDVIAEVDMSASRVSSELTMLTIKGIVKKLPGNRIALKQ